MTLLSPQALGRSGLQVAPLSLGTVKLGRNQGVKYPQPFNLPDDRRAQALLDTASELGINLLDTAPAYGESETRLGALLRGQRQRWIVCTKVGESFENGQSRFDFTPTHCRASVERSLRRLRTDVLDIVLIHSDGNDEDILNRWGTLDALQQLKQEGKVRAVGLSHKSAAGGQLAVDAGADVIMATLNRDYLQEQSLITAAAAQGCGVLIKKALASGHADPSDLAKVAGHPGVHSIVIGTTSPEHLRQNAALISAARQFAD